ncbi:MULTISPECIES: hypothetical protein [unclassified Inquilinus]|uniref:hypothetical protein n=1 Tax=unclassified Inquilinus TaxID=2645927 RepID=UPI003F92506D
MAKTIWAASAATAAALLIASPALAQTVLVPAGPPTTVIAPAPAPMVVTPTQTVIAPAPIVTEPVTSYPIDPYTRMPQPYLVHGGVQPYNPPVTAMPSGPSPADPREYATDTPITVTGRIDGVTSWGGVTSFRLQTPTEAWTVVVPTGEPVAFGRRTATVTGYPHVEVRNQLLAQSVMAGR